MTDAPRTFTDGGLLDEQEGVIRELASMRDQASRMQQRLAEMDVRSGAIGAAKVLAKKIENAIAFIERNGGVPWDESERLACNAWRIASAAANGALPPRGDWLDLDEEVREAWRHGAQAFRSDFH